MKNFLLLLMLLACSAGNVHVFAQQRAPEPDPEKENLIRLSEFFHQRYLERRSELERIASENNWPIRSVIDNVESELKYVDENGFPHYDITDNLNAARTTNTNQLWTGGTSGLNLMGNNYLIGIWDGGSVRDTHQEFATNRVTIQDGSAFSNHGTHVGGTMIAAGVVNAAHGMAPQALLHSYDWNNDLSEMAAEATAGLTLSNHSYGRVRGWAWGNWSGNTAWHWWGDISISSTEDYLFGFYDDLTQSWDQTAHAAPHYLIVKSAGNDRNENHTGGHYVLSGGSWVWSNTSRDPDGGADGYDCIAQRGVAKNILTVGAVNDIPGGWTQPSDVVMTAFSGWGPTDDGRIKPDIVANGMDLYSTGASSDSHYYTTPGTSMSAPNVTGTLALLQEHFTDDRGGTMSAAALKGLAINTANEAGPNDGPDYMFGWGLLNATGAAELITNDADEGGLIVQGLLVGSQIKNYTYYSDGSPIRVTLCWTDPPGTPPAASLNPTTRMLVNDLDLRVIRQNPATSYWPWRLNLSSPAAAATKGDNIRDNVERVDINNPTPGYYTIRVSHKGSLSGGQQAYALIVNGLSTPPTLSYCEARTTSSHQYEHITRVQMGSIDNLSQRSPGGYSNYTGLVTEIAKGASQNITVTLSGGFSNTRGRIWIDWNQNGVFDAGELVELGSGEGPTYTTNITAPAGAMAGYTTMRIRVIGGIPGPCTTHTWGETEDYTIKVGTPGLWAGTVSTDWFNPLNWDDGFVPTQTTNVNIPAGTIFSPVIGDGKNAYCNNLFIQSGATLTQNSLSYFRVHGTFDPALGQFTMTGSSAFLYFEGTSSISWWNDVVPDVYTNVRVNKSDPAAIVTMRNNTTCSGTFQVWNGTFALSPTRTLNITSTANTSVQVRNNGTLNLVDGQIIQTAGGVEFQNGSNTNVTGGSILCGGNFRVEDNTSTNIQLTNATVVLNGSGNQLIQDLDGNSIHHLTIDKPSGTASIDEANLSIAGNLNINSGTFSLGEYNCGVTGNLNIYGSLIMPHTASRSLSAFGNVVWFAGSSANMSSSSHIEVYRDWNFNAGTNVNLNNGFVNFRGSHVSWIRSYSDNSNFHNLRVYKASGFPVNFSNWSTHNLVVNGYVHLSSTSTLNSYSNQNLILRGNFNFHGTYDFTLLSNTGSVIFDGSSQMIYNYGAGSGVFNNVVINSTTGTTISNGNVAIAGNLTIEQGSLSPGTNTINIAGNWTNNNFPAGFVPGDGRVVFNGSDHQYVHSSENFNILEANMGAALRVNGISHTVTCNLYDWTSGGIDVLKGTFTALDLAQDVLTGGFWVNPDATINLHQAEEIGQYVDLGCSMVFSGGGTINVYGGSPGTNSWWPPSTGSGSLTMSGGVLDFKDAGINIRSSGTLTTNLTGGAIRTSGAFLCSRPTFTPTAGTFEFYGSGNYNISQSAGSLCNVNINKSASRDGEDEDEIILYDKRSGELFSDGGRSGAISLNSNFMITNNLTVESGMLNIGAHELTVAREAYIDGTLSMTNASGILNAGTFSIDWLQFRNGSVANITHGTINCYGWIIPSGGSSFNLGLDNTLFIKGNPSGGLSNFEPNATYGNVVIAKNAGAYSVIDGSATEPVVINGDFTISADNTFRTQYNRMTVHGEFTDAASSVIQVLFGSAKSNEVYTSITKEPVEVKPGRTSYYLEIDSEFDLKGQLLINNTGTVYVHGRFSSSPGSSIHINNGSFISDAPNHADKGWQYLNGNLTLINGLFEITNNSVNFGATATTSVSGGVIRSGGAFAAVDPGIFQPTGGVVEIIGSHPDALIYCYNTNHFHNLTILRTGGYSQFMYGEPIFIQNNFTVNSGEIRSGASEISVLGDVAVNSGGHLSLSSIGSLLMSGSRSINVNDGGLLEVTGNITNQPKISRISSGHYAFNVESGGTIAAEYALFEYMNSNGINIKPGAIVDHTKAFHNCTFRLGESSGRLLTINNNQTFAVNNASFPTNTWGGNFNVSKTVNSGVVTFMGYGGDFAGGTHEQDPNNRIHWGGQTAAIVVLEGVEVVPGQDICFEATNTLTVGGSGTSFEVQNGGFVELVAGQKIEMLEGTHFHNGSYGLARITTTSDYCSLPAALIAVNDETLTTVEEIVVSDTDDLFFKVYPNPTTGLFTLELAAADETAVISVEIYSMLGESLLRTDLPPISHYQFDLSGRQPGIYLIRVMIGDKVGLEKLIKQ